MVQSMYAGSLGIQAHQKAMDIEGNNVANVNTVGYKYSRANFSDMLNQTFATGSAPSDGKGGTNSMQVGLGSEVSTSTRIFKQGALQPTDKKTDVAISGEGFFAVTPDNGYSTYYTRAGNFDFDTTGNLVDPSGNKVLGWNANSSFEIDNTAKASAIKITPYKNIPANETSTVNITGNLNSEESIKSMFGLVEGDTISVNGTEYKYTDASPAVAPAFHTSEDLLTAIKTIDAGAKITDGKFVLTAANKITAVTGTNTALVNALTPLLSGTTSSKVAPYYQTTVDVYDSLGEKHTLSVKFNKSDNQKWTMSIESSSPVDIGATAPLTAGKTKIENIVVEFNTDGSIKSNGLPLFKITGNNGSTAEQTISLNLGSKFDGLTSLAKSSDAASAQDGYASGSLEDMSIDSEGYIVGSFSNGVKQKLAQLGMARFNNNEGLDAMGSNLYTATRSSGQASMGVASVGGRGAIAGATLEMSNVDLSNSLTQLIVIQRGFQASSKTITTSDTMLDTLMQMKR